VNCSPILYLIMTWVGGWKPAGRLWSWEACCFS
jgi:hypothetical protein